MNDYYIYEWFNIDNHEVFYVGKGRKNRYKTISGRNPYFINYYNKYNCNVRIIFSDLTEDEAFNLEIETIKKYKEEGFCKCNLTDGGEQPPTLYGKDNAMYGRPWWDENTPKEKINKWKNSVYRFKEGELNPQYNVSPKQRMNKQTYDLWREKHKIINKGELNPQYGIPPSKRMDSKTYIIWKEKHKLITGSKNPNSKGVNMYDVDRKLYKSFSYIGECVDFLLNNSMTSLKENTIRTKIRESIKNKTTFLNYYFEIV